MSSHDPIINQIVAGAIWEMETGGSSVVYDPASDKIRVSGLSRLDPELLAKWKSLVSDHRGRIVAFLTERSRQAEKSALEAAQKARDRAEIQALNNLDEDNFLLSPRDRELLSAVHRVVKRDQNHLDSLLDKRAAKQRAYNERLDAEIKRLTRDSS